MKFTNKQFIPGQTSKRVEEDHSERYKFAAQFVKDKNVLDIACGVGYGSKFLKEAGAKSVDGVDISAEAIEYAKENYSSDGINFIVSDAIKYTPNKKYDVIVSFTTIEQILYFKGFLKNLYNLLNPDGILIISTFNKIITSPHSIGLPFNIKEFTIKELSEELENSGFTIIGLFGQRFQRYFKNRYLRRIYKIIFKPDERNSPVVSKIKSKFEPRYFIIKAHK